jgi:hypothetical protein
MSKTAKFISGDGVEHEVSVESVAFELMSKDGAFKRLDTKSEPVEAKQPTAAKKSKEPTTR